MVIDGVHTMDSIIIMQHVIDYNSTLFQEDYSNLAHAEIFQDVITNLVTVKKNASLLAILRDEEIKTMIFSVDPNSSSVLGGFSGFFFQHVGTLLSMMFQLPLGFSSS